MKTIKINGLHLNLADIEKDCCLRLLNGSLKGKDPMHNPVVANEQNGIVHMRTVVLRNVSTKNKTLTLNTDIRSGKWPGLQNNKNISWLFYDAGSRFQIRIGGTATLHNDDEIANEAWLKSNANSRKIYMGEIAPSEISALPVSGLPIEFESTNPTIEETEIARKNFGIIITKTNWMEWLWLNSAGHRRAKFEYKTETDFKANWLIP